MEYRKLSLSKQFDIVFKQLREELKQLNGGTVFIQIRNDLIGKFGIRHLPMESMHISANDPAGLSLEQIQLFRDIAIHAMKQKCWTHGEVSFEFALLKGVLRISTELESNYNMAALLRPQKNLI